MQKKSIGVGLMGLGVVGGQVAKVLTDKAKQLEEHAGAPIVLRRIKVLRPDINRPQLRSMDPNLFTTDEEEFFNTPDMDIVVEVIGGERPAYDYLKRAIAKGCHVATANKEVISKHGRELRELAQKQNVSLRFEAAVGGGIPLIAPFHFDLVANKITGIQAIINGTTNFILTRMERDGAEFSAALKEAQKRGYAESDPRNDIEGIDAAYKLSILASLATHYEVRPEDVYHEGISKLTSHDFKYARELGYAIKLLAICKNEGDSIEVRVHPVFIPEDHPLAWVNDVYNAILVEGDLVGKVLFFGEGAGPLATSSAVVADIVTLAQYIRLGVGSRSFWKMKAGARIKPMADIESRYYFRMTVEDRFGVLAQISKTFGDNRVSIASVVQKETDNTARSAELVILSHKASERAVQKTLGELKVLPVVRDVDNCVRIED